MRPVSSAEFLEPRVLLAAAAIGVDSGTAALAPNRAPTAQDDSFTIDEDTTLVVNVAPITRLHMESEKGDWIGQGRNWSYTRDSAGFDIGKNYDNGVTVRVTEHGVAGTSWGTYFAAPNEALLTTGHYSGAIRWPFQTPNRPGLDVSGDGRGSNTVSGNFTIHELVWDTSHTHVIRFAASFEQHSEGKPPALTGIVQYNSLYGVQNAGVLLNDSDPDGDTLRSLVMSAPTHGTVAFDARGALVYTPDANFSGVDSFTYVATDGEYVSNAATVSITIRAVNDVPLIKDERITTPEDRPIQGTITATDADHPGLLFAVQSGPAHGVLTLGPRGYYAYTPDRDFHGADSFRVRATNTEGAFDIGTITVAVTPVNDPPVAHDDYFTIDESSSLIVSAAPATVLHMESDPGEWIGQGRNWDNSLADATFTVSGSARGVYASVIEPDWGSSWSLEFSAPAGTMLVPGRYTGAMRSAFVDPGHPGLDISGNGRGSNTLTGEFTVQEFVWNATTKKVERFSISFEQHSEGHAAALTGFLRYNSLYEGHSPVLTNDTDVEQTPLEVRLVSGPQHGTVTRDAAGALKYRPHPGFIGRDSFTYRVSDGERLSNLATATLDVADIVPDPTGVDDAFTVSENGLLGGNVLTNDINHTSGPLTVTALNGIDAAIGQATFLDSGATLWVLANGSLSYRPGSAFGNSAFGNLAVGETASDEFSYELTDANGGSSTAHVRITITGEGANDLIGNNGGGWYVAVSDGHSFHTSAWAGWSDADWDALREGDFNGDGRTDVLGLLDGAWFVGISNGTAFTTSLWSQWSNVDWHDVFVADLNRDGRDDILARNSGNWWASLSHGTTFGSPTLWATWADLPWDNFAIGEKSSDSLFGGSPPFVGTAASGGSTSGVGGITTGVGGTSSGVGGIRTGVGGSSAGRSGSSSNVFGGTRVLFGFIDGEWWAASVNAANDAFAAPEKWAALPDADYDAVKLLDYDGNRVSNLAVLDDGTWTISARPSSSGPISGFYTIAWADTRWQDIRTGDFDGDGHDDILARAGGAWWMLHYENDSFTTSLWGVWSDLDWQDVTVADFDGDGSDDLAGRYAGAWWVGTSTGSSFDTTLWETWTPQGWDAVLAGDVDSTSRAVGGRGTTGVSSGGSSDGSVGGVEIWSRSRDSLSLGSLSLSAGVNSNGRSRAVPTGETFTLAPPTEDASDREIRPASSNVDSGAESGPTSDETAALEVSLDDAFLDHDSLLEELLTKASA